MRGTTWDVGLSPAVQRPAIGRFIRSGQHAHRLRIFDAAIDAFIDAIVDAVTG